MTRRILLAPYNMRVSAARHIAEGLGGMRILPEGSRYVPRRTDLVINWGRSNLLPYPTATVLNNAEAVSKAIHKDRAFWYFTNGAVPTVEWTTDMDEAMRWTQDGHVVVERTHTTGRGGEGINLITHPVTEYDRHPGLWTKYFKRKHEYRVHVLRGQVIDVQQKKKLRGGEADPYIRSYDNGWVFCRNDVSAPACVLDASIRAVEALGLDFGGVDVGYNLHYDRPAVFEVNTAPGIEGTTVENYIAAFKQIG